MARPVKVAASEVIDFPAVRKDSRGSILREKRAPVAQAERAWVASLMACSAEWSDVIGLAPLKDVELEHQVRIPRAHQGHGRRLGMPRVDALAYSAGQLVLIEAKLGSSAQELLGGAAQLLHYKTMMEKVEGRRVAHLVLASPSWPPFLIETLDEHRLPVRLLKANEDIFAGAIPSFLMGDQRG